MGTDSIEKWIYTDTTHTNLIDKLTVNAANSSDTTFLVAGYTFLDIVEEIDVYDGFVFGTTDTYVEQLTPEPATMIVWSLLGAMSWLGMRVWRGGRRTGRQPWSPENRQAILDVVSR